MKIIQTRNRICNRAEHSERGRDETEREGGNERGGEQEMWKRRGREKEEKERERALPTQLFFTQCERRFNENLK